MTTTTTTTSDFKLFTPLALADDLVLKNRIIMSPMTRARCDVKTHSPNELTVEYYEQRASAGLIITEATAVSAQGFGWYGSPGLYTDEHEAAWTKIVDAVHAKGGKIFVQIWHMGRLAHSSFNGNHQIVSASAVAATTSFQMRNVDGDRVDFETPRALELEEIPEIIEQFRSAAERAKRAGFDGVEIHGANGFLVDQFLQSVSNTRTDKYGGSIENRTRFLLEVVEAVKTVWPSSRVGVRLSPNGASGGMGAADSYDQFTYAMAQLSQHNLAYLAILDGEAWGTHGKSKLVKAFDAKHHFKGVVIAGVGYTRDTAEGALRSAAADAVGLGRAFIANPDLVERLQNDWPLVAMAPKELWWDPSKGAEGYTTYKPYST